MAGAPLPLYPTLAAIFETPKVGCARARALCWMFEPGDVNKWKGKVSVKRLPPGWGVASPGSGAASPLLTQLPR